MAFTYTNSRGVTYTLHASMLTLGDGRKQRLFFFDKIQREGAIDALPEGHSVFETRGGLPMLRAELAAPVDAGATATPVASTEPSGRKPEPGTKTGTGEGKPEKKGGRTKKDRPKNKKPKKKSKETKKSQSEEGKTKKGKKGKRKKKKGA